MTTNEQIITEVPAEALSNSQRADEVVKTMTTSQMVEELKRLMDELDFFKMQMAKEKNRAIENQSKYLNIFNSIEGFITEHVKDNQIHIDDLKDFAEELGITLTKSIRVTFSVNCEYEFNVPLDFDEDEIDDSDFDIHIRSNVNNDDVEETSESYEVEDFEVSDND